MRMPLRFLLLSFLAWVSCRGDGERPPPARRQAQAPLTISIQGPAENQTVWASVEVMPVPAVQFKALIRSDPNHMSAVMAPSPGLVTRIRAEGPVGRGEPIAVLAARAPALGRELAIPAKREGVWHPRRQVSQVIAANDTLGILEERGYALAVGAVSDQDYRAIHPGDSAIVELTDDRHQARRGKVEWVRPPWQDAPYTADVAVEFQESDSMQRPTNPITVIVMAGPGDSGVGVPPSAIVHLPPGPAVFVAAGEGRYEVRWVSTGPRLDDLVYVREGLGIGVSIVAKGLAPLAAAALDSLERRGVPR